MRKEIYSVKCPKQVQFGDPMYFEEYEGRKLENLVVDCKPPRGFVAKVVLVEEPMKEYPDEMSRTMTLYMAPKETIDTYNTGESRGRETSHSLNYQKLGKELMSQDELAVMDGGKCILQLRGVRPFLSDKYDITKHPNFKYTADADEKNAFDIEAFLSARLKLKPNEVCDVYEVDTKGA